MSHPNHVPLLDLKRLAPELRERLRVAFERVLASGQFILGPEIEAFESECACYFGLRHAIGVSSGTDALLLALMALGIGPGDEVVVPAYSFFATAGCVARVGARPIFCDVDETSFNLTAALLEQVLTSKTRAIIPVHLFGQPAEMDEIRRLSERRNMIVIEDAAQAIGAEYQGAKVGTLGQIGCFSFFPTKNLGALGDGGMLVTHDEALAAKLRALRNHGMEPKYFHKIIGGNFRLDALQAAFLRERLLWLERWTNARANNAQRYGELFAARGVSPKHLALPVGRPGTKHVWNQYVVRVKGPTGTRDRLKAFLSECKIDTEVYYPLPLHLQECFASLAGRAGQFPVSEAASRETLALPNFPELTAVEQVRVVGAVADFFECR